LLGNDPQRNHQYDRKGKRAPDPKHVHEQACLTDLLLCILLLYQRKSANHVIIAAVALPTCFRAQETNDTIPLGSFFPHWVRSWFSSSATS
jgi:hypothetical protein